MSDLKNYSMVYEAYYADNDVALNLKDKSYMYMEWLAAALLLLICNWKVNRKRKRET